MKHYIEYDDIDGFLKRFNQFSDTVMPSVTLRFDPHGTGCIHIVLLTRDSALPEKKYHDQWVCVEISVEGVTDMALMMREKYCRSVICFGIHIVRFGNRYGIEFGGALEAPATVAELQNSECFALGAAIAYEVLPYPPEFARRP